MRTRHARSPRRVPTGWRPGQSRSKSGAKRAIVLDVDDTTLTTWNYELFSNWDFNPATNANFVGPHRHHVHREHVPRHARHGRPGQRRPRQMGYAVFFLTGRGDSQHNATIANLVNDTAAGFSDHRHRDLSGDTVPEIDAGYVTPTPIDTGHGGFSDGLFTKPPVGSYPAYLNTPRVLRVPRSPRANRAQPSSTSPAPAHTSNRRATTSSATSATSSAISKVATRTRRSRCRTRTTTSRSSAGAGPPCSNPGTRRTRHIPLPPIHLVSRAPFAIASPAISALCPDPMGVNDA